MMINVECATQKDYQKFQELQRRFVYLGSTELRDEPTVDKATFDDYVSRESMMVAYEGDTLVGYAFVDGYDDGICSIREIFVDPKYQHKGYGKQIVQKIREEAKASGFEKLQVVSLWMETDNFWMMKCGFRPDEGGYLVQKIN